MRARIAVAALLLAPALAGVAHSERSAGEAGRPAGLALDPDFRATRADPGEAVQLEYTLENTGEAPQKAQLSVRGYPSSWPAQVRPEEVRLEPGAAEEVVLHVYVPEEDRSRDSSWKRAGNAPDDRGFFRIRAQGYGAEATANATVARNDDTDGTPDLAVRNITWEPARPAPGDEVVFSATLYNVGDAPAEAADVGFAVDRERLGIVDAGELAPGESVRVESPTWTAEEGTHRVYAAGDPQDEIDERSESNNVDYERFAVYDEERSMSPWP